MKIEKLNEQYKSVCNEYIDLFCKKQQIEFDGWVGDEIGGIAGFAGQYFFGLSDIILDLTTKQKKWLILEWQDDGVEFNSSRDDVEYINYKSYTMGLRYKK